MVNPFSLKLRGAILWLSLGLSGAAVFFVAKVSGLEESMAAIAGLDVTYALLCVFFTFIHILVRTRRWQITIFQTTGYLNCLWSQGVGFLFTMFLPFRLGDAVRIVALNELEKVPLWSVAASVLVERVIDVAVTLVLFLCLIRFLEVSEEIKTAILVLTAAAVAVSTVLLLAAYLGKTLSEGRLKTLIGPFIEQSLDALRYLVRKHVVAKVTFWTLLGWAVGGFRHWLALMAFVPDATILESLVLTVMLSLAMAIPSAPGFIGVFQFVGQQALVIPFAAKYDYATALGVTIILHLALFFVTTVIGVLSFGITGHRLAAGGAIAFFKEKARAFTTRGKTKPPDA